MFTPAQRASGFLSRIHLAWLHARALQHLRRAKPKAALASIERMNAISPLSDYQLAIALRAAFQIGTVEEAAWWLDEPRRPTNFDSATREYITIWLNSITAYIRGKEQEARLMSALLDPRNVELSVARTLPPLL